MPQCAFHPDVETNVRCGACDTYICPKDMVPTPVGYKCRECARPAKSELGYVKPKQYAFAALAGLGAGILGGLALGQVHFGSLLLMVLFGLLVGEATRRGAGGHRTTPIAAIAGASAGLGALAGGFGLLSVAIAGGVAAVSVLGNRL
jgi:hypothetical protein